MKNIMIDKKGIGPLAWDVGISLTLFLVFGTVFFVSQSGTKTLTEGLVETQACPVEPYLDITVRNASIKSQTSGSATFEYGQDMKFRGALTSGSSGTALRLGETYDLIVSEASHLDVIVKGVKVANCGANQLTVDFWRSDGGNITSPQSIGLTDNVEGGAINMTSITSGTSRTTELELASLGDQSINPTWITIEVFNKTAVQDIRMTSPNAGVTVTEEDDSLPGFASSENTTTTNYVEVFKVSGITDEGEVITLKVTFEAHASFSIDQTAVYVNGYSEQAFSNIDGSFTIGIEDSDNNAKYETQYTDFDFIIT